MSQGSANEPLIKQLHLCAFIEDAQNVVLIGGPGPGTVKTHLATAIGIQAIEHHLKRVRFFSTIDLVNQLELETAVGKQGQLAFGLMYLDLVVLDELGYLPFSKRDGLCCFIY